MAKRKPLKPLPRKEGCKASYKAQFVNYSGKRSKYSLRTTDFFEARKVCDDIDILIDYPEAEVGSKARAIYFDQMIEQHFPETVDRIPLESTIDASKALIAARIKIYEQAREIEELKQRMNELTKSDFYKKYHSSEDAPTLHEAFAMFKKYCDDNLAPGSYWTTCKPVESLLNQHFDSDIRISEITNEKLAGIINDDSKISCKSASPEKRYRKLHNLVNNFFNRCHRVFGTSKKDIPNKKANTDILPWLNSDEVITFLNHHTDLYNKALAATFVLTGFRSGAVRQLTCGDVLLKSHKAEGFDVPMIRPNPNGRVKRQGAFRTIPINSELVPILAELIGDRDDTEPLFFGKISDGTFTGDIWDAAPFSRYLNSRVFAGIDVPKKIDCLVCRRTFGQIQRRFGSKGLDDMKVLMGHANVATTNAHYTGLAAKDMNAELNFAIFTK